MVASTRRSIARIIIAERSNLSSGGVRIYFDGTVTAGSTFTVSAAIAAETEIPPQAHFSIRDPVVGLINIQTGQFRADCTHDLFPNDQFDRLRLTNAGF